MANPIEALRQLLLELGDTLARTPSRNSLDALHDALDALNHQAGVAEQLRNEILAAEQAGQLHIRQVPLPLLRVMLAMASQELGHE